MARIEIGAETYKIHYCVGENDVARGFADAGLAPLRGEFCSELLSSRQGRPGNFGIVRLVPKYRLSLSCAI